jgi:hypothetical protein
MKELIDEIVETWTDEQLKNYITALDERVVKLSKFIKHLKYVHKKRKQRKPPLDTGTRSGA